MLIGILILVWLDDLTGEFNILAIMQSDMDPLTPLGLQFVF